jgi:hemerythrin-like domain-containing protein
VRIDRASLIPEADLIPWQKEIGQLFQSEIAIHFTAEEQGLFPVASKFPELAPLVEELFGDHATLREYFDQAKNENMSPADVSAFAQRLSAHIRKEERRLFQRLQELLNPEELANLGVQLTDALKEATVACALPTLRPPHK